MCAQPIDATITMTVSRATKNKHDLPSTTIAKSKPFAFKGEAQTTAMVATNKLRKKLKDVGKLNITTKFVVRSPIADTTKKVTTFSSSANARRLRALDPGPLTPVAPATAPWTPVALNGLRGRTASRATRLRHRSWHALQIEYDVPQ